VLRTFVLFCPSDDANQIIYQISFFVFKFSRGFIFFLWLAKKILRMKLMDIHAHCLIYSSVWQVRRPR
jgi:hypothetical protein